MDNNIKNLCTLLTDILSFKKHNGNPQEIVVDSNNRITTPQSLTRFSANDVSQETALENARARLSDRLIQLKIDNITTKSATNIEERIYSEIESFYVEKGFMPEVIKNAIELSCDPSYGMNEDLFTTLLEPSRPSNQDQLATTKKYSLTPSILADLEHRLLVEDFKLDRISALLNSITQLATDDEPETILAIINTLQTEYNIGNHRIVYNIMAILFSDDKLIDVALVQSKDTLQEKQIRDTLRLNSEKISQREKQKNIERNKQHSQKSYEMSLKAYRSNGLELDKKHTLAIGRPLIWMEGFNPKTTVFAHSGYADLNGDIFNTIDTLYDDKTLHGKLSLINFKIIFGEDFNNINKTMGLMRKLHTLLQPDGILVIDVRTWNAISEINSNSKFADKILAPSGFKSDNIVGINSNRTPIADHAKGEEIFNKHKYSTSDENNEILYLIAKK